MNTPFKCFPAFKDYLWGGEQLGTLYAHLDPPTPVAEAWVLSCNPDGESVIATGPYKGSTLSSYIRLRGDEVLGSHCVDMPFFPLLIKLIDAKEKLSIQVHPDDAYALENEGSYGKTEMWYVLDCEEDAYLYYGFKKDITRVSCLSNIMENTIESKLNKVPVKKGDIFFIPPGTVHAIGGGILLAEVQQNSSLTYRMYDYDRRDAEGNPRELHVEKAIAVSDLRGIDPASPRQAAVAYGEYTVLRLASCPYFTVEHVLFDGTAPFTAGETSFQSLTCIGGEGVLRDSEGVELPFEKGDNIFVPAGYGEYRVEGNGALLLSYV